MDRDSKFSITKFFFIMVFYYLATTLLLTNEQFFVVPWPQPLSQVGMWDCGALWLVDSIFEGKIKA